MKCIPLNTSAAFHSRYMQPAREAFEAFLREFQFEAPKIPVISNVSARPYEAGARGPEFISADDQLRQVVREHSVPAKLG